jgi:signal transduction histidine kinase
VAEGEARRGPSAALVLGVLAGCVAAIAVLPTALPLVNRLAAAEGALAQQHAENAVDVASRMLEEGGLEPGSTQRVGMEFLQSTDASGHVAFQEGAALEPELLETACATPGGQMLDSTSGESWAIACVEGEHGRVVAGWRPNFKSRAPVILLVFTLSGIVGIVTALGVLRMLYPVSQLSRAIVRVGAGERGVRVPATGLVELDELAERLNSAARAMEDREDAIMSRIKAVQEMARIVAHEVRNPLQSLELLTSLIASESDAAEREQLAQAIHAEIRALDMVVTRVLREGASRGASRLPLIRTSQRIDPLVDHVLAIRNPEARVHGILLERGPIAPIEAAVDAALLGRSIENLVLNAMQAVGGKGGRVKVSLEPDNDAFQLVIEDNGPGVDPSLADHIFEPNVTGRTGGTGLGLALVKEVVDAHGGYIRQDRSPLGGARFILRIPLAAAA